jgi:hypothetical protein
LIKLETQTIITISGNVGIVGYLNVDNAFYQSGYRVGFYGGRYNVGNSGTCYKANPFTGGCSCPPGFSADGMYYNYAQIDSNGGEPGYVYFCYRW